MTEKTPLSFSLNTEKSLALARALFPHEKWVDCNKIHLKHKGREFDIPEDINNLFVAQSRITRKKGDERILAKEIRQAHVLAEKGDCVYLIPKEKDPEGKFIPGPDAIVNGIRYEFKTITGSVRKVEKHFRNSREQCENIFLRISNNALSKEEVLNCIHDTLNKADYSGGTNGWLILHMDNTNEIYRLNIKQLK